MGSSSSMYIGVSGLNSFSSALSVVADNVANSNTTGYKANSVRFGDMVSSYYSTQSVDTDRAGSGSAILGIATDFSEGPMVATNKWSDVAINGNGFFTIDTPAGRMYTRDGSFHMDQNGNLVTLQGYSVLDSGGNPINVDNPAAPQYTNYNIDADGMIWGTPVAGGDPVTIAGPIGVTIFPNQDGLIRQGANLYTAGPQTGAANLGAPNADGRGFLLDLNLENSNVDLAMEMVNMIIYQADYNANSKSILTASEMLEVVTNLIR
ncbi:MAG: flagellar hook basal-body protein [Deltaproteobacteria bacterium]|nr:flagellar hook basal-body protein [Deltaproteobacteria bacterium]